MQFPNFHHSPQARTYIIVATGHYNAKEFVQNIKNGGVEHLVIDDREVALDKGRLDETVQYYDDLNILVRKNALGKLSQEVAKSLAPSGSFFISSDGRRGTLPRQLLQEIVQHDAIATETPEAIIEPHAPTTPPPAVDATFTTPIDANPNHQPTTVSPDDQAAVRNDAHREQRHELARKALAATGRGAGKAIDDFRNWLRTSSNEDQIGAAFGVFVVVGALLALGRCGAQPQIAPDPPRPKTHASRVTPTPVARPKPRVTAKPTSVLYARDSSGTYRVANARVRMGTLASVKYDKPRNDALQFVRMSPEVFGSPAIGSSVSGKGASHEIGLT